LNTFTFTAVLKKDTEEYERINVKIDIHVTTERNLKRVGNKIRENDDDCVSGRKTLVR
jgi:hypothetical protein